MKKISGYAILVVVAMAASLIMNACAKERYAEMERVILPDTVSFQKHVLPIFNRHCNNSGCHSGNNPAANLDLSPSVAYQQLWKRSAIDTVRPEYSVLYVEMNSVTAPMPPSGRLPDKDIAMVFKWIVQNAKNN